jgi:hypothetical protein
MELWLVEERVENGGIVDVLALALITSSTWHSREV